MSTVYHEEYTVIRDDYTGAGKVSSKIKKTLNELGVDSKLIRNIAVACYEAEINMIIHAYGGVITLDIFDDGNIELNFNDLGPGIPDIEKALNPGYSTASEKARALGFGAGMGLPNIKRVSDEFNIESSKEGTKLKLRFHA